MNLANWRTTVFGTLTLAAGFLTFANAKSAASDGGSRYLGLVFLLTGSVAWLSLLWLPVLLLAGVRRWMATTAPTRSTMRMPRAARWVPASRSARDGKSVKPMEGPDTPQRFDAQENPNFGLRAAAKNGDGFAEGPLRILGYEELHTVTEAEMRGLEKSLVQSRRGPQLSAR